jgi:two-component sensor histidine kinase
LREMEEPVVTIARWDGLAVASLMDEVRAAVLDFAVAQSMAETTRRDLGVALREALANAAQHAYPVDHPGDVRVDVATDGEHLTVRVADEGAGAVGREPGLGVQLMRGMAERVEIGPASRGPGTVVLMEFPMAGRSEL